MNVPTGKLLDTTIRPVCFNLNRIYSPNEATTVGPIKFKKYEYILYVMAQFSRIVYCDTGIIHKVIQFSLGKSNDIVNKVILALDNQYKTLRYKPIESQKGTVIHGTHRPMESYSLGPIPKGTNYGTYISTPEGVTCLITNANVTNKKNEQCILEITNNHSILKENDIIITFKGTSILNEILHDIKSQFTPKEMSTIVKNIGLNIPEQGNVAGAFLNTLINAWGYIKNALVNHTNGKTNIRLFITGHSLGGAYAGLLTYILGLFKKYNSSDGFLNNVIGIHLITFGSPTFLSDKARNNFNMLLDEGTFTVDRIVSQAVAARSSSTQVFVGIGGILGPNDLIPNIPVIFSHPGYRPLATEIGPEGKGRPYSMDYIRSTYGVQKSNRYRDERTWPFYNEMKLGDRTESGKLDLIVAGLTGIDLGKVKLAEVEESKMVNTIVKMPNSQQTQTGGLLGIGQEKGKYDELTKKRIPNFVSVRGSLSAAAFAHAEYLGMFFFGAFRLPGMKNPSGGDQTAVFTLHTDGVKINYTNFKPVTSVQSNTITTMNPNRLRTRKNRSKRNHKNRKSRRRYIT